MGFLLSCESFLFYSLLLGVEGVVGVGGWWVGFGLLTAGGCRTTTELTARLSLGIARLLGLESVERVVEFVVRGVSESLSNFGSYRLTCGRSPSLD